MVLQQRTSKYSVKYGNDKMRLCFLEQHVGLLKKWGEDSSCLFVDGKGGWYADRVQTETDPQGWRERGTGSCCLVGAETRVGKMSVQETDNRGGTTR